VGTERQPTADQQRRDPDRCVEVGEGGGGEDGAGRHPDEGVHRVPDGVDGRNLVGHELDQIEQHGQADDPALG
jgi:hypothetical protein